MGSKAHLEHPSQATACGTTARHFGLTPEQFRDSTDRCKSCERVLAAIEAGRPANSGVNDLIQRVYERSRIRRGRMAVAPVFYVTDDAGVRWRFLRKFKAALFVAAGRVCENHKSVCCDCDGQPLTTRDYPEP